MKNVITPYWSLDIPDDWSEENDEDVVSLYAKAEVGALQISASLQDQPIEMSDLQHLAAEHIDAGAKTEDITLGEFEGFTLSYTSANEYWREWYLMSDELMLFVTYVCDLGDEDKEEDIIEAILETLRCH